MFDLIPNDISLGSDCNNKRVELSCHIVVRAFANTLPSTRCVDGLFSAGFQHSWLMTENSALIDVFPVQVVSSPLLFWHHPTNYVKPSGFLYQEDPNVMHGVYKHVGKWQFDRAVGLLTDFLIALR
ncbi:MAG: hypothetical protein ACD_81C00186G0002 [uncultured bacterium]|nr:MAG: hypothetical protein ACD_81C00186G0002 [uncultured bacterium]